MTETDWLTGTEFVAHVQFAANRLSLRRLRLLAAGFCRAVPHIFDYPELITALAVVESYADGRASAADVENARQRCRVVATQANDAYNAAVDGGKADALKHGVRNELAWAVAFAATSPLPVDMVGEHAANAVVQARSGAGLMGPVPSAECDMTAEQAIVMRGVVWDVVGNPFRAVAFAPDWRTDTAVALAHQMYESREFGAMPILADALQDAGCGDENVLNHCRHEAGHARGCWVVDRVLGKE